jgi:allantoicase
LGLSVYRCKPLADLGEDGTSEVRVLERHPFTKQAFIPMGKGSIEGGDGLTDPGAAYLVIVAKDDPERKPDLKTLKAFVATGAQGVMYEMGVWRKSLVSKLEALVYWPGFVRSTNDCPGKGACD